MDVEYIIVMVLREAAFRRFVDDRSAPAVPIVRFLRASQKYADAGRA